MNTDLSTAAIVNVCLPDESVVSLNNGAKAPTLSLCIAPLLFAIPPSEMMTSSKNCYVGADDVQYAVLAQQGSRESTPSETRNGSGSSTWLNSKTTTRTTALGAAFVVIVIAVTLGTNMTQRISSSEAAAAAPTNIPATFSPSRTQTKQPIPLFIDRTTYIPTELPSNLSSTIPTARPFEQPPALSLSKPSLLSPNGIITMLRTQTPSAISSMFFSTTPSGFSALVPSAATSSGPSSQLLALSARNGLAQVAPTAATTETKWPNLSFYVMGDVPYTKAEEKTLINQLKNISSTDNALFIMHVGDLMSDATSNCEEHHYTIPKEIFKKYSHLPVLCTPGDNDWTDCPIPASGFKLFTNNFVGVETNWNTRSIFPSIVTRSSDRKENFAFWHSDVLFLGLNMVEGRNFNVDGEYAWRLRMQQNIDWFNFNMNLYQDKARAVIIFGHCCFNLERNEQVHDEFKNRFHTLNIPVLYVHGHGHKFRIRRPYGKGWKSYWHLQVDAGGIAPPIKITIRGTTDVSLATDFGTNADAVFGNKIMVDRRGGVYANVVL